MKASWNGIFLEKVANYKFFSKINFYKLKLSVFSWLICIVGIF